MPMTRQGQGSRLKIIMIVAAFVAINLAGCATYQQASISAPLKLAIQEAHEADDTYFETGLWRVVLKENQEYLGASVIRLKRVCGDIACLTKEEWEELHPVIKTLEDAMRSIFGTTMFNTENLMNHAFQDRPYTPLMHLHFTPRYDAPVVFAGEIFTDKRFGHRLRFNKGRNVSEQVRDKIKSALRNYFNNTGRP